jgi:hypothetical protein
VGDVRSAAHDVMKEAAESGETLTSQQFQMRLQNHLSHAKAVGQLGAGTMALLTNQNVNTSIGTAQTATEHNLLPTVVFAGQVVMSAYTAYELMDAALEAYDGNYEKARDMALSAAFRKIPFASKVPGAEKAFHKGVGKLLDHLCKGMGPKMQMAGVGKIGTSFTSKAVPSSKSSKVLFNKSHQPKSKAQASSSASVKNKETKELLPNEGKVGSYKELKKIGKPGDNLTPNYMPQASYLKKFDVKNKDGIFMMMEHHHPGMGGRHRLTRTYGKRPDFTSTLRSELAKDIKDARQIYKNDGLYTSKIRESLQEVIKQNKDKFPDLFKK